LALPLRSQHTSFTSSSLSSVSTTGTQQSSAQQWVSVVKPSLHCKNLTFITGALSHGTHSALFLHYAIGIVSQFYLRKYRPNWFIKYNYIMSAGLDGGAQLISFILTFTVLGAGGKAIPFPPYWGNNYQKGNYDYCMRDPAMGKKMAH
jgi:hypothetical protein